MEDRQFDTLLFSQSLAAGNQPALAFGARNAAEAKAWQRRLRAKVTELVGGFPQERPPLGAEVIERREFPTYVRETVVWESREHLSGFGHLLVPKGFRSPGPTVICLPGHGRGCDDIVGIREDGTMRDAYGEYQNDFALQCVDHGFTAFAMEQLGFGHRRDEAARAAGAENSSCQPASGAALQLGQTMVGWRVWDVMRAVDYLETREEVDAERIGCMGISGGGTITFFASALESRIKVAVVSGYFNTFRDSILSISHCICNYVPGMLQTAEMYDLAGLIAPRPFFVESGTDDPIFPVAATRSSFGRAQEIYRVFDAADRIGLEIFEGEHSFYGKEAFRFLERWL
ncbi:MAG: alpha/beta hydrolase family protein [Candidatus Latescibacterota bacterium]